MDRMYAVDGQKHAWAGHSCGAVKANALLFPYASPSGKAEGSADIYIYIYIYIFFLFKSYEVHLFVRLMWCHRFTSALKR